MPLKPGQKKNLNVEVQKLKGLKQLEQKVQDLLSAMSGLNYGKLQVGKDLKKEFEALADKVQGEITAVNTQIKALKATAPKKNPALDKLVKTIAKECSKAIGEYRKTGLILLRGVGSNSPVAFMGRSWNNRESKDSSQRLQEIFDNALKSKGFKALRGNSIFTTTDDGFAASYGDLYYIFPKNSAHYTWSKYEKDLVLDSSDRVLSIGAYERVVYDVENWYLKTYKKELNWYYEDPYEAMYDGDKFLKKLVALKYPKAKTLTLNSFVNWDFINKEVGPTATNFAAGLKSGNEMLISGEYYAIHFDSPVAKHVLDALKLKSQIDDNNFDDEF